MEGAWGETAKNISIDMLKKGLVTYIASDAHSVKRRPPILSQAKQIVSELIGQNDGHDLFLLTLSV
ncbi:hypothetical protein P4S63_01365 [Pseudoalteromonas sp. B193]